MGTPFFYRLSVTSKPANGPFQQQLIPIYAFKAGDAATGRFMTGDLKLQTFEMIASGADGARQLTVSTHGIWAHRALAKMDITDFRLFIHDSTKVSGFTTAQVVATINCKDMHGGPLVTAGSNAVTMSCEPVKPEFQMVTLSFFDYGGGPVFTKT